MLYVKISFQLIRKYKFEVHGDDETVPEYIQKPYENKAYVKTPLGRYLNSLIERFHKYITPNYCLEHFVMAKSLRHYKEFDPYEELYQFAIKQPDKFNKYVMKMQRNKKYGIEMLKEVREIDLDKYCAKKSGIKQRQIDTIEALICELERDTKCRFVLSWSYYSGRKHEFYDVKFHKFTLNEMMNIKRSLEKK